MEMDALGAVAALTLTELRYIAVDDERHFGRAAALRAAARGLHPDAGPYLLPWLLPALRG
jgi:hypothetical protein